MDPILWIRSCDTNAIISGRFQFKSIAIDINKTHWNTDFSFNETRREFADRNTILKKFNAWADISNWCFLSQSDRHSVRAYQKAILIWKSAWAPPIGFIFHADIRFWWSGAETIIWKCWNDIIVARNLTKLTKIPSPEQKESTTIPCLKTNDCVEISSPVLHEFVSPSIQNSVLFVFKKYAYRIL